MKKWPIFISQFILFLILSIGCATPQPITEGCIKDVCSFWNNKFCELCDGYNENIVSEKSEYRLCPTGRKHVKLCCNNNECHRLDRDPECNGVITVCQNWIGKNTFDSDGVWLREGTCYQQEVNLH